MSVEQLDANESQAFLTWRRSLARLEENDKLLLTPFEKNLDIWRQLWRVVERSDLVRWFLFYFIESPRPCLCFIINLLLCN